MSRTDPHDHRLFEKYVKLNPDGTVAAVVEVDASRPPPVDGQQTPYTNVTAITGDVGMLKFPMPPIVLPPTGGIL